jgi:TP901-1 family phage major tail protein
MSRAVHGKNKVLLFRIEGEGGNAWKLAFQQEHDFDNSRDFESDPTKDGNVLTPGEYEGTLSFSAFQKVGDDKLEVFENQTFDDNPQRLEVWEINTTDLNQPTTRGLWAMVYINSCNGSAPSDGKVEYSIDAQVDGKPKRMDIDVTVALKSIVESLEDAQVPTQPTQPTTVV